MPNKTNIEAIEFNNMNEFLDYYTYLDKVIELQKKYPISQNEKIIIPTKFHVTRQLLNSSLMEDNFKKAIEYLNKNFKSKNMVLIIYIVKLVWMYLFQ